MGRDGGAVTQPLEDIAGGTGRSRAIWNVSVGRDTILFSLTYTKAIVSLSYSLATNCFYLETGFVHSVP